MAQIIVFLALLFSIVIAIFAVQNTTAVTVSFLTFTAQNVAVSVLVLISAALGAAAMLLLGIAREVGLRWQHRAVSQQLRTAQSRLSQLESGATTVPAKAGEPLAAPAETATPADTKATSTSEKGAH